jgi:hypothetical protein
MGSGPSLLGLSFPLCGGRRLFVLRPPGHGRSGALLWRRAANSGTIDRSQDALHDHALRPSRSRSHAAYGRASARWQCGGRGGGNGARCRCFRHRLYGERDRPETISDLQSAGSLHAKVAKLADAPDLGSGGATRGGSSPPFRTTSTITHPTLRDPEAHTR